MAGRELHDLEEKNLTGTLLTYIWEQVAKSVFRIRRRDLFWLLELGLGVYILFPQLGELNKLVQVWHHTNPAWLLLGLIGSILTYVLAPFPLRGALQKTRAWPNLPKRLAVVSAQVSAGRSSSKGLSSARVWPAASPSPQ